MVDEEDKESLEKKSSVGIDSTNSLFLNVSTSGTIFV
jgi:hypothetical protein